MLPGMKFLRKIRFIRLWTYLCLLFSLNATYAQVFTPHYNTRVSNKVNGFYEYLPQGYSAAGTILYPVLITLSGFGEMGDGGASTSTGLPLLLSPWALPRYINDGKFPVSFTVPGTTTTKKFIVICPQFIKYPYPTPVDIDSVITYVVNH